MQREEHTEFLKKNTFFFPPQYTYLLVAKVFPWISCNLEYSPYIQILFS